MQWGLESGCPSRLSWNKGPCLYTPPQQTVFGWRPPRKGEGPGGRKLSSAGAAPSKVAWPEAVCHTPSGAGGPSWSFLQLPHPSSYTSPHPPHPPRSIRPCGVTWRHSAFTSTHPRLFPGNSVTLGKAKPKCLRANSPVRRLHSVMDGSWRTEIPNLLPSGWEKLSLILHLPWPQFAETMALTGYLPHLTFFLTLLLCYLGSSTCN